MRSKEAIRWKPWILLYFALMMAFTGMFEAVFLTERAAAFNHVGVNYFANKAFVSKQTDCPVINGGYHGGANAENFINAIEAALAYSGNSGCNGIKSRGAAYIIKTMLGKGPGQSISVSGDELTEWRKRVRAATIVNSSINVSGRVNTSGPYRSGVRDIGQWIDVRNRAFATTEFRNSSGNSVYIVKNECGNPVGNLGTLPPAAKYDMTPSIEVPETAEGGQSVLTTPSVENLGPDKSVTVTWRITSFNLPDGQPMPTGATNNIAPQTFYDTPQNDISIKSGSFAYKVGTNNASSSPAYPKEPFTVGDFDPGTRVCFILSLNPYTHTNSNWRHSEPDCLTIVKKPKVQVVGSDLIVGKGQSSDVTGSMTTKLDGGVFKTFGSWAEYAIIASGTVSSFGSGGGFSGGNTATGICPASYLTLTNAGANRTCATLRTTPPDNEHLGGYAQARTLPDIASRFVGKIPIENNAMNVGDIDGGIYYSTTSGTVTIGGGTVSKGESIIILAPNGTVNLTGDIFYTDEDLQTLADIPQVVIIANNIKIDGSVGRLDAWLVANGSGGNINTCSEINNASELNATKCTNKLLVNGPVIAKHLYLYRTAGAGKSTDLITGSRVAAERFNLRPDAYLWATGYTYASGRLQTVKSDELPPRF